MIEIPIYIILYQFIGLLCAFIAKWTRNNFYPKWQIIDDEAALTILIFWPIVIIILIMVLGHTLSLCILRKMGFEEV